MRSLLFEDPFKLGCLLILFLMIAFGVWFRFRTPLSARGLQVVGLLIPLLLLIQNWVVTDREQIELAAKQLAVAVETGDANAVLALCDQHARFEFSGGFDSLQRELDRLLARYTVSNPRVGAFKIEIDGGEARVTCRCSCTIEAPELSHPMPVPSRWEIHYHRVEGVWEITDLRPLEIAGESYDSLKRIP